MYIVTTTIKHIDAVYTTKLFKIYLSRPLVYHLATNSALLLRNLHTGVGMTMDAARLSLVMVFDGMVMLAIVLLLFFTEPQITIIAVLFLTVVAYLYYKIFTLFRNVSRYLIKIWFCSHFRKLTKKVVFTKNCLK